MVLLSLFSRANTDYQYQSNWHAALWDRMKHRLCFWFFRKRRLTFFCKKLNVFWYFPRAFFWDRVVNVTKNVVNLNAFLPKLDVFRHSLTHFSHFFINEHVKNFSQNFIRMMHKKILRNQNKLLHANTRADDNNTPIWHFNFWFSSNFRGACASRALSYQKHTLSFFLQFGAFFLSTNRLLMFLSGRDFFEPSSYPHGH